MVGLILFVSGALFGVSLVSTFVLLRLLRCAGMVTMSNKAERILLACYTAVVLGLFGLGLFWG